jgi:hypothetical protein
MKIGIYFGPVMSEVKSRKRLREVWSGIKSVHIDLVPFRSNVQLVLEFSKLKKVWPQNENKKAPMIQKVVEFYVGLYIIFRI